MLPEKQEILLTDTVGFIQKLPHTLVKAFRATLEEVQEADLLLHVVDCSNENYEQQIESVVEVLKELDAVDKPTLYVFNKADRFEVPDAAPEQAGKGLTPAQETMMLHGREASASPPGRGPISLSSSSSSSTSLWSSRSRWSC